MRPDSSWCSLCYHDMRPASALVTASGGPADDAEGSSLPLVDVAVEPQESDWHSLAGDDDIVDAELVGEDGRIIAPRSGSHDSFSDATVDLEAKSEAADEPSGLARISWSCKCGEEVTFDEGVCPVCGGTFLSDLRDGNGGRHRQGNSPLSWLPESRQVRLAAAAFVAIFFAVLIPVLITLFG